MTVIVENENGASFFPVREAISTIIRKIQQLIRIAANESGLSNPCCIAHHVHCKKQTEVRGARMTDFLYEYPILWEWISFAVRWLHVITAIAWIGSSFYFIALDLGLVQRPGLPEGAYGEEWQVHGGGFYHIQKYLVAPERLPEHLTWFKWESYVTWLSGFAMLCVVYYAGAELYLIDTTVLDVSAAIAISISLASIVFGWIIYDLLCKSPIGQNTTGLMLVLFAVLVAMAWGYTQVFSGRAALLHLGAFTATIMSANVAMIIIPNQKIVVADLKAGRTPDPKYGRIAKQRSLHNNYLTLPVIFLMLSNHYPLAFATQYNWLIAAAGVPDGRDNPALVQHHSRAQGKAALDLGCHYRPVHRHDVAFEPYPQRRSDRGSVTRAGASAIHRQCPFPGRQRDDHGPLLDVPCGGAFLGRHCPRAKRREAGN
jgi:hypothetical protein